MKMRAAAFFDMDRTLLRCNSGTLYIKFLRRRREISLSRTVRALGWMAQYKLSVLDMEAVTAKLVSEMAGEREVDTVEKCLLFFAQHVQPQVAPRARQTIEEHRRAGHVVAILSSSTPYITEPLARHLGIDHVLCTRASVRDGRFDGTHVKPACYGRGKVHWAESFAREQEVDLERSFFYTDSFSDLPMLERVGERRVINPDARLLRHARRVGWQVEEW
jgi:HAD superfamily hydrolase (TIGR01490 family)